LFPPGTPNVKMTWNVMAQSQDKIAIFLVRDSHIPSDQSVYGKLVLTFYRDKLFTRACQSVNSDKLIKFLEGEKGYGCTMNVSDVNNYLDAEGSFNLKVEAELFVESDGLAEILPVEGQEMGESEVQRCKLRKEILLGQVGSLLGDEITSDMIVSVVDKENVEVGIFFCHSVVLSGK